MAKLSVNETTTFRWTFEEDIARYRAAGIPAMGVWRQKLSDCGEARGMELLHQSGLEASHLLWAGGFTGSDGRSFKASIDDAREAIRLARDLAAGTVIVYSGTRAGHTYNHARRLVSEALKELAPLADELGVTLALEPMHPESGGEFTFLATVDDVLELMAKVDHPRVKFVFDTYHLGHDPRIVERVPQIADNIALVQLGDARQPPAGEQNRCRLGEGIVPLAAIVAALKRSGYDGYYDVELLGEEIEATDYDSLLAHAKQAYAQLLG